jgi:hypothetical protein
VRRVIFVALAALLVPACAPAGPTVPSPPDWCPDGSTSIEALAAVPLEGRVMCFGGTEIRFVATGGTLMSVFPGVEVDPAFGGTWYFGRTVEFEPMVVAWLPPTVPIPSPPDAPWVVAPGDGIGETWWSVAAHIDDPASVHCRSDGGGSTIDGVPMQRTDLQAVIFCRNQIVIHELSWLRNGPEEPTGALVRTLG